MHQTSDISYHVEDRILHEPHSDRKNPPIERIVKVLFAEQFFSSEMGGGVVYADLLLVDNSIEEIIEASNSLKICLDKKIKEEIQSRKIEEAEMEIFKKIDLELRAKIQDLMEEYDFPLEASIWLYGLSRARPDLEQKLCIEEWSENIKNDEYRQTYRLLKTHGINQP